jgi:hypothetical protein
LYNFDCMERSDEKKAYWDIMIKEYVMPEKEFKEKFGTTMKDLSERIYRQYGIGGEVDSHKLQEAVKVH